MSCRKVLSFGFIPADWKDSQDGDQRIMAGNPDGSNTDEFSVEFLEDDDFNAVFVGIGENRAVEGDEFWDSKSALYKSIAEKIKTDFGAKVSLKILQQLWALFQDELEVTVKKLIVVAEEGNGAEFINDDGKYNGCIYASYFSEDEDGEISGEKVVVIKC